MRPGDDTSDRISSSPCTGRDGAVQNWRRAVDSRDLSLQRFELRLHLGSQRCRQLLGRRRELLCVLENRDCPPLVELVTVVYGFDVVAVGIAQEHGVVARVVFGPFTWSV